MTLSHTPLIIKEELMYTPSGGTGMLEEGHIGLSVKVQERVLSYSPSSFALLQFPSLYFLSHY